METVECPYCERDCEINHDDGFGYEEDVNHEMECDYCHKSFIFNTSIIYHYSSYKADCLNDAEHDYQLSHTHPKEFSKMICSMCGDERELTNNEIVEHNIGTKEDYFNSLGKL